MVGGGAVVVMRGGGKPRYANVVCGITLQKNVCTVKEQKKLMHEVMGVIMQMEL